MTTYEKLLKALTGTAIGFCFLDAKTSIQIALKCLLKKD